MIFVLHYIQATLEESLKGLEVLMNEFFAPSTGNERKREIGRKLL